MGRKPAPPRQLISVTVRHAVDHFLASTAKKYPGTSTLAARASVMRVFCYHVSADHEGKTRDVWTLSEGDFNDVLDSLIAGADAEETAWRQRKGQAEGKWFKPRTGCRTAGSIRGATNVLTKFAKHCHSHRWLDKDISVDEDHYNGAKENLDPEPVELVRIPENEWSLFLEAAETVHPRCRIAIAIGLYCGRRVSEWLPLRWEHIDWQRETINFYSLKTGKWLGDFPLYDRIAKELTWWRKWVTEHHGIPQPDWYVIPGKIRGAAVTKYKLRGRMYRDASLWPLDMTLRSTTDGVRKDLRRLFAQFGIGPGEGTGTHTMRRSAGPVMLDTLDGDLAALQQFFGHKLIATTQIYMGEEIGRRRLRDKLMKERPPTKPVLLANVIPLHKEQAG